MYIVQVQIMTTESMNLSEVCVLPFNCFNTAVPSSLLSLLFRSYPHHVLAELKC